MAQGLADLGISCHSTVAIGDAENDHSLLGASELGVAVGNAVAALKAAADVVLAERHGPGVASLLRGPVLSGRQRVHARRWRINLGTLADRTPVLVPSSQLNVLVVGGAQRGKSYLAGLFADTGLPHWVIIDEAHVPLARDARTFFEPGMTGYCLVTHRPEELRPEALLAVDVVIAVPGDHAARTIGLVAAARAMAHAAAETLLRQAGREHAVLLDRGRPGTGRVFAIGRRKTAHMRYWHKYSAGPD